MYYIYLFISKWNIDLVRGKSQVTELALTKGDSHHVPETKCSGSHIKLVQ